jgi:tRNA modification GTPase
MKEHVLGGKVQVANRATISNRRQKESLIKAIESLEKVKNALEIGMTEDFIAIDLHDAYGHLGMIVGEELKEEIIDQLFSRFCLGK